MQVTGSRLLIAGVLLYVALYYHYGVTSGFPVISVNMYMLVPLNVNYCLSLYKTEETDLGPQAASDVMCLLRAQQSKGWGILNEDSWRAPASESLK